MKADAATEFALTHLAIAPELPEPKDFPRFGARLVMRLLSHTSITIHAPLVNYKRKMTHKSERLQMTTDQLFTTKVAQSRLLAGMDIEWHIGDVIAKARKRRRLNQTDLAKRVGVNKATIVRAEDGDPKVARDTYLKIATAVGTELVALETEAARLRARDGLLVSRESLRALHYAIDDLFHTIETLAIEKSETRNLEHQLSALEHLVERLPDRPSPRRTTTKEPDREPSASGPFRPWDGPERRSGLDRRVHAESRPAGERRAGRDRRAQ